MSWIEERFGLADDRAAVVEGLTPGSEEQLRLSCLLHQHEGRLDEAALLLQSWVAHHGHGALSRQLADRLAILRYDGHPEAACAYLKDRLELRFDHAPPLAQEDEELPTRLDPGALDPEVLTTRALEHGDLSTVSDRGLFRMLGRRLDAGRRRALLARLRRPDPPGLVEAVAAELSSKDTQGFAALPIHELLTDAQLDALSHALPGVARAPSFVALRAARLQPESGWQHDPSRRGGYLAALDALLAPLDRRFDPWRAFVLGHRLHHERALGRRDELLLQRYLALPRTSRVPAATPPAVAKDAVELGPLLHATGLPPLDDDEPLVRDLLAQVLGGRDDAGPYLELVDADWLRQLLAESGLCGGHGDATARAAWARTLGPDATAALQARVDLELAPDNPTAWPAEGPVSLDVWVKNAETLVVKTFALDVAALFHATGRPVGLDVDVDGIVPTEEQVVALAAPPMLRARRTVTLPAAERPGVYLVLLVAGGRACRALLCKGTLHAVAEPSPEGLRVFVLDDRGVPVAGATLSMGDRQYEADAAGAVTLPRGARATVRHVLLEAGPLRAIATIEDPGAHAVLTANLHTDRETMLAGMTAPALLRPSLRVGGAAVPLDALDDTVLEVRACLADQTHAQEIRELAIDEDGVSLAPVRMPEGVLRLSFTLRGVYTDPHGDPHALHDSRSYSVNLPGCTLDALHASAAADGYRLWLLGRNGEPRAGVGLSLWLWHTDFTEPVEVALRTDADGCARLGPLAGIERVRAESATGAVTSFALPRETLRLPPRLHLPAGQTLRLPWLDEAPACLARRAHVGYAALISPTSVGDGQVCFDALPAGRYALWLGDEAPREVVVGSAATEGWLRLGDMALRTHEAPALELRAGVEGDELVVRVGDTGDTRVHVLCTQLLPEHDAVAELFGEELPEPARATLPAALSTHGEASVMDGEQRYVLERRHAERRPGNLLPRPSLLMAPMERRETATVPPPSPVAAAPPAEAFRGAYADLMDALESGEMWQSSATAVCPSLDFLDRGAAVLCNLRPDDTGTLRLSLAQLPGTLVRVIVQQGAHALCRHVRLPPVPLTRRDRRFADPWPMDRPIARLQRIEIGHAPPAGAHGAHRLTSIAGAHALLTTLTGDAGLQALAFLVRWHELDEEARRRHERDHACHELHLFLAHKDRSYFDAVVRPRLASRHAPSFMDRYLLGDDLRRYADVSALRQLNLAERVLAARRLGGSWPERVAGALADRLARIPPDPDERERIFRAALGQGALEALSGADDEVEERAEDVDRDEPPPQARARGKRKAAPRPRYRAIDATRELAERRYHGLRLEQEGPELVAPSPFWLDLARHEGEGAFLSPHIGAVRGTQAMLLALALCDLPLEPLPEGPAIVFYEAYEEATPMADPPLLVHERYLDREDRHEEVDGEKVDKPVTGPLLSGRAYVAQVVIGNTSSSRQRVEVLLQVPEGSMPLGPEGATWGRQIALAPYETKTLEHELYFPAPGDFAHARTRLCRGGLAMTEASPRRVEVLARPLDTDAKSWPSVAHRASLETLLAYLQQENLDRVNLADVAWRLQRRESFEAILTVLEDRLRYDRTLWSYAVFHQDRARLRTFLADERAFLDGLGERLVAPLLDSDRRQRRGYEHLEYDPFVRARAHRLGDERTLDNSALAAQHRRFCARLAETPRLDDDDRLEAAYYLLLQDRVDEGLALLARVDRSRLTARVQLDYLDAYAAFYRLEPEAGRAIAERHAAHPDLRWRERFAAVLAQTDELRTGQPALTRPDARAPAAAGEPTLELHLDGNEAVVTATHVPTCELGFHLLDSELMFSRRPFADAQAGRSYVLPHEVVSLSFEPEAGPARVAVPASLAGRTVLIRARGAGLRREQVHYGHRLSVQLFAALGQLRVHQHGGPAVPGAYVKVYTRSHSGQVRYHKDGYTDLRGAFDYATVSGAPLDTVARFALLVLDDTHGALVREVDAPAR